MQVKYFLHLYLAGLGIWASSTLGSDKLPSGKTIKTLSIPKEEVPPVSNKPKAASKRPKPPISKAKTAEPAIVTPTVKPQPEPVPTPVKTDVQSLQKGEPIKDQDGTKESIPNKPEDSPVKTVITESTEVSKSTEEAQESKDSQAKPEFKQIADPTPPTPSTPTTELTLDSSKPVTSFWSYIFKYITTLPWWYFIGLPFILYAFFMLVWFIVSTVVHTYFTASGQPINTSDSNPSNTDNNYTYDPKTFIASQDFILTFDELPQELQNNIGIILSLNPVISLNGQVADFNVDHFLISSQKIGIAIYDKNKEVKCALTYKEVINLYICCDKYGLENVTLYVPLRVIKDSLIYDSTVKACSVKIVSQFIKICMTLNDVTQKVKPHLLCAVDQNDTMTVDANS